MPGPTAVARRLDARTRPGRGWSLPFQLWFPLVVYAISRLITALFMLAATARAHRSGYSDLATAWDGGWYRAIATQGYPTSLPLDTSGQVGPNAWAFSPGYPMLVRAVMAVTGKDGRDYSVVAPTLSLVLGGAAMVVLFVLMERAVSRFYACACVLLTCTFMAAPVMQLAYGESLTLLLLAGSLLLLRGRRYLAVAALVLILALTRPIVVAFMPVVIAHGVSRWRWRALDPFPRKDQRAVVALTAWCVTATGLWPVIVAVSTGDIFAWTKTHEAWRSGPSFPPGLGWPGSFLHEFGWLALATLAVIVLLALGIALRPGARAWGPELRVWSIAYPGYLLLATAPGPSVIRWLLLAFPLMWPFPDDAATASERRFRILLIAALAVLGTFMQWIWVSTFLATTAPSDLFP
jgi:hypothetical protein